MTFGRIAIRPYNNFKLPEIIMEQLQKIIEQAFERRADITPRNVDAQLKEAIDSVITQLDQGKLRVAEKINGDWVTHQWLKKAVLLSFRIEDNAFIKGGFTNYYDKVPSKFADYNSRDFREGGFRVVPPAAARRGAFIAKNVILMPSYVNIGAMWTKEPWWTPGRRSAPARRSAKTYT